MQISASRAEAPVQEKFRQDLPTDAEAFEPATPERQQLSSLWADPPGLYGIIAAVQNDAVGGRLMLISFFFFLAAGVSALLLRVQLAVPENDFLSPEIYNGLFTIHGSTMMYLFAVPFIEGVAILILPSVMGSREMPFPRLGAFSQWTFLFGGILFFLSIAMSAMPDNGWYAYLPISGPEFSPNLGMEFWLLALSVAEVGAIAAGVEIIIAILRMRTPGMSLARMPVYLWAMLVTAFMVLFAFTTLIIGSLLLELDRKVATQFFNPNTGGSPLLWQHLFWIFGHPEVYIQFVPAAGIASTIIPVFARKRLSGYSYIVLAMLATGFLSFGLWAHHMYTVGLPAMGMAFFSAASILIGIPAGIQVFSWIATIWGGRPVFKTPFLFCLGFIFLFVLGGITGIMVGSVPFDQQVQDSYFVVAHFHYVLIGGVTFPLFAAVYFWMPKISGKLLSERLGTWNFWLMFVGFNLTFFPMHIAGLLGMPRRYYTYQAGLGLDIWNQLSTAGGFLFAAGVLLLPINYFWHLRRGQEAGPNPWGADSLEWSLKSPLINYSYAKPPIVSSRHPLWDQEKLYSGPAEIERFVHAIGKWPTTWRAAIVTSLIDARPQEVFRVTPPSAWPFVAAIGMVVVFGGEIFELRWLSAGGLLLVAASLVFWNWPKSVPTSDEAAEAFAKEYGIPVHPNGSRVVAQWGVGLAILIFAIGLSGLLFSYYYLRVQNPVWPPEGTPLPPLILPGLTALLLLLGCGVSRWAVAQIRLGSIGRLQAGLAGLLLLGGAAVWLQTRIFAGLGFDWTSSGYGSAFYILAWFSFATVFLATGMSALLLLWSRQGAYSVQRYTGVENLRNVWWSLTIAWIVTGFVIYVTPYL